MDYLQLEFPIAVILVPTIGEAWSLISYHTFSYYIPAQVRKSVDGPPDMLTEDHHHTVHEERQVCYSSHLRPKSLHL